MASKEGPEDLPLFVCINALAVSKKTGKPQKPSSRALREASCAG
jgi:hypothetical protein